MIRYNLQKLSKLTKDDCGKILRYFYHEMKGSRMDKLSKKIYEAEDKYSFILNETDFLSNSINVTPNEMCISIYLAGYRNYLDYSTNGQAWLHVR